MLSLIRTVDEAVQAMDKYAGLDLGLSDQLGGFDQAGHNKVLATINNIAKEQGIVQPLRYHQVIDPGIKSQYSNLSLTYDTTMHFSIHHLQNYTNTTSIDYKNLLCSFNGTDSVSRRFLLAAIYRFGLYNPEFVSKNFVFTQLSIDGALQELVGDDERFFIKFFAGTGSEEFFQTINAFGEYSASHSDITAVRNRHQHYSNIQWLEPKLTGSFLHLVSETGGTSYQPFVTEKFLHSVVTRGLYVAYAQPNWHKHIEQYYGFKPYIKIFDYTFDCIQNPIHRLLELIVMVSKFSRLSIDDWNDLRLMELDTIEYNYTHYYSCGYLDHIAKHSSF